MNQYWILAAILLPILGGALTPLLPFKKRNHMLIYLETITVITSAISLNLLLHGTMPKLEVVHFVKDLSISFKIDGMTMIFGGLVSVLWPFCMLYAFEYMEHERKKAERIFFMFYSMTFGVTLGISYASNMLTMYMFYEMLTLVTVPLIMHSLSREAILATRKYLYYSLGGAAFAMMGMVFLIVYSDNACEFTMGGVLRTAATDYRSNMFLIIYLLAFMGFGVKAAIWPMSGWLPDAGVAPTPVTGLLHAVAVVKAGAFGIIRLTYYCFGTEFLRGTWVQNVVMGFSMFTIVYGCAKAVSQMHIKRRLAYSTVSNLSYILFGVTIMTPFGFVGAVCHMICHAFMKICSFFCAGAIMHKSEKKFINELDGMAKRMPIVFACFTVSALALAGVPGLAGFVSKWNLAEAAVESGNVQAYFGIACLLISALLTVIYMMTVVFRAYFPRKGFDYSTIEYVKDPSWKMCVPLIFFVIVIVALGLFSPRFVSFVWEIAEGIY
ncbi:MAG: proton-conducting transporter membrane subunit [Eubacteriales bacterium]|nr:proton-conducting transporter membrane subunit [Eubacteriales bacterium]